MRQDPMWVPVHIPAALLPIQPPANSLGKTEDGLVVWGHHGETRKKLLTAPATWEVNPQLGDLSVCLSV